MYIKDKYTLLAKKKKLKSRSWFKLNEIQKETKIIKKNINIIDLGCYPGGWIQFTKKKIGKNGKIFCCDILPIKKKKNIFFTQGDICNKKIFNKLIKTINKNKIKVILSDISPNISGIKEIDNPKYKKIIKKIILLCKIKLIKNGHLIIKIFLGENFSYILKKIKNMFKNIKIKKPKSSRLFSKEIYIIALKYKKKLK